MYAAPTMVRDMRQTSLQMPSVCSLTFDDQLSCLRIGVVQAAGSTSSRVSLNSSRCSSRATAPSSTKFRRFSFDDDEDSSDDAWPALKVRRSDRATDLLRVTRVEMHRKISPTTRVAKQQYRRRHSGQESIKISEVEETIDTDKSISRQAPCSDRAIDVIKLLNIDEDDTTSCRNDEVDEPVAAAGVRLFEKRHVEHEDYKLFQRNTFNTTTPESVISAPITRSTVLGHDRFRGKSHGRPSSAQVRTTGLDVAFSMPKKLTRSAVHMNSLSQRTGKTAKSIKRLLDREPPDAIRIDTQVIDYGIETAGLRECKDLQIKLERQGVNLSLETLKKGLLPPTQYGFERRQVKTLPEAKIFNYSDGLFSHPSTWMPAQSKSRLTSSVTATTSLR